MLKLLLGVRLRAQLASMVQGRTSAKRKSTGKSILMGILVVYVLACLVLTMGIMFYSLCGPLVASGLQRLYFATAAIMMFAVSLVTSMFSMVSQIYRAKDNNLLLSLPINRRDVVLSRLASAMVFELAFSVVVALPALVVYLANAPLSAPGILFFLLGTVCLVMVSTGVAAAISWVIYKVSSRFRKKTLFSVVLSLAFLGAYFYGYSQVQNGINALVSNGSTIDQALRTYAFPAYWFAGSILGNGLEFLFLLMLAAAVLFLTATLLIRGFNPGDSSSEVSSTPISKGKLTYGGRSPLLAIAMKDVSRFLSSSIFIMNGGLGSVFAVVLAVMLALRGSSLISAMGFAMPDTLIPVLGAAGLMMCCSMNMVSCALISLEGRSLWVLKSAPISASEVLCAKALAHVICTYPPAFIASVVGCFIPGLKLSFLPLMFLLPMLVTVLSALFGVLINLMLPRFDWTNEVAVIKQSMSTLIGMLGMMAITIIPVIFMVKSAMNGSTATFWIVAAGYAIAAFGIWKLLCSRWAARRFSELG